MDDKLQALYNSFCELKDGLNSANVTEKTVNLIGRFGKAIRSAEDIVLNPPKRDTSFDSELHLKSSTYLSADQKDLKDLENKIRAKDKDARDKINNPKKKPGPKPKNK